MNTTYLQYILQHNCRIGINKAVVAGVSGGPDSLCLLDILWRLGYPVVVAHLNHGLRSEADEEAIKVEQEAITRNLPFIQNKVDVKNYAENQGLSVEEAARIVRYRFLFEQARVYQAQAVAVGHTADDQVETVLMHFLRGTGLAGLGGMQYYSLPNSWDQEIALVRPLLGTWREEIMEYLQERCIQPEVDESNQNRRFFRNRLRHELIPELEKYNPQIKRAMFNMADILRGDEEIVRDQVDRAWKECCVEQGPGYLGYAIDSLSRQSLGLQRQLLRRGLSVLVPGLNDIDFKAIERGIVSIKNPSPAKTELMAGVDLRTEAGLLWLATRGTTLPLGEWPQVGIGMDCVLNLPGECNLGGGWVIRAGLIAVSPELIAQAEINPDPFQVWMDEDKIKSPISVRRRKTGDKLKPLGMGGHSVKLTDFMINLKIPSRARDGWPVITCAGEIIWVPGYRMGEFTRLRPSTRHAIHMQLSREEHC